LTYASTALPPNIEPHMQGLDIWQQRKPLIYENLIWVDESLEARPELAERWEPRSPTEYVFRLRHGVRFHNGKELDAEDVKNATYWGPTKPALERIVFQAIPDESSIVAGLRTGQVTMAQFSSALSFQVARGIATLQTIQAPSTRWVVLDLAGDMEPTSKPEVRQAI